MFKRLRDLPVNRLVVDVDGRPVECVEGDTVAAVLLAKSASPYRHTIVSGAPRMPVCMVGVCFDCLVEIDGAANQQGCLRVVTPGMKIRRQTTVAEACVPLAEKL